MRVKDKKYLNSFKNRRCLFCRSEYGVVAHHLLTGHKERGMGIKAPDNYCIPLCFQHHSGDFNIHFKEKYYLDLYKDKFKGWEPVDYAKELYKIWKSNLK